MIPRIRLYTNVFVVFEGKILLGMKKRGVGEGLYNGFGGKVEPGETPLEAAHRELKEECGIDLPLIHAGRLLFLSAAMPSWAFHIELYRSAPGLSTYTGELAESDEMRPEWFPLSSIPYSQMWSGDKLWLPLVITGEHRFLAREDYDRETDDASKEDSQGQVELKRWWIALEQDPSRTEEKRK